MHMIYKIHQCGLCGIYSDNMDEQLMVVSRMEDFSVCNLCIERMKKAVDGWNGFNGKLKDDLYVLNYTVESKFKS